MTLSEKAALLSGKNEWQSRDIQRLRIPSVFFSDGPHGIRKQEGAMDHLGLNASVKATCFPTAAAMANSWNPELGEAVGRALGEEAAAQDVDVLLSPGLNIKRNPLCGRNFEYFSEDPYLSGKMAAAYVRGIQSRKIYACPKHFAANNQELHRMAVDSVVDERTLRELYLTGFEIAVTEGKPGAVMTSYNRVNGIYANEHPHLIRDILREEWGFQGMVVSDWGGSDDHIAAVKVGSNLEMPNPGAASAQEIIRAVKCGALSMDALNETADTMLDAVRDLEKMRSERVQTFDEEAHHTLARQAAAESIVLLKNEAHILPLKKDARVALIGDFAFDPRYQGEGSSIVNASEVDTVSEMIGEYALTVTGMVRGYRRDGESDEVLMQEALACASDADVVLYFFGLDESSESEGFDRAHMRIHQNQVDLLSALYTKNENIVGILSGGSVVEMPWQGLLRGLLHGYLTGQAGAGAVLDVLTGRLNPSGKLSETYPVRYEDTPSAPYFPGNEKTAEYRESLFVGYRYFDTTGIAVQYPFGYGLSYTQFQYSSLVISGDGVRFSIKNIGDRDGAEIAQLYIGLPDSQLFRPKKELKGFQKVFLSAGETKTVSLPFDDKSFRYWNVKTNAWEVEEGTYKILIGASVSDIRLQGTLHVPGTLHVQGNTNILPYRKETLPSYYSGNIRQVPDAEFAALLGHPIPDAFWAKEIERNDPIERIACAKSRAVRFLYRRLDKKRQETGKNGRPNTDIQYVLNMPFRALSKVTEGKISPDMVDGILTAVNGHLWRGLVQIFRGYLRNRRAAKEYEKIFRHEG